MTTKQKNACHTIIHSASASAGAVGAGLAQIPCSDSLVIGPIQTAMTVALGEVFGIKLKDSTSEAAFALKAVGVIGRKASQVLVGWIPGFGNAVNACTAALLTEATGWVLAEDFARKSGRCSA